MDDPTPPPLATYPAPKVKKAGMPLGMQRALFLVAGIAIGGVIFFAAYSLRRNNRVVYRSEPPRSQALTNPANPQQSAQSPAAGPAIVEPGPAPAKPDGQPTAPTGPAPKGSEPFNPFDGSLASSMPPKEISGHIAPGPAVKIPANPGAMGSATPTQASETATPKGLLVTVRLDVSDPDAAVKALQALAAKESGSAVQFDEAAMKPDAEGAILFVPATKAAETEKQLASVGSVVATDKWNGSAGDRVDRIEATAQDKLSQLHLQRQELLLKYFEDAPEIQHIDEDSARIRKSLESMRSHKAGAGVAVFKIKFLG